MSSTSVSQPSTSGQAIATNRLFVAGAIAAVVATVANLLVYFAVPALFNFTLAVPLQGPGSAIQPLPPIMVIIATIAATLGAVLLLAVLNRFTDRPLTIFRVIAVVVLLLSFAAPLSLPVPLNARLALASMHVITAAIITYVLPTRTRTA